MTNSQDFRSSFVQGIEIRGQGWCCNICFTQINLFFLSTGSPVGWFCCVFGKGAHGGLTWGFASYINIWPPYADQFFFCLTNKCQSMLMWVCTIKSDLQLSVPTCKLLHHRSSTLRRQLMACCSLRWKSEQRHILASSGESVLYTSRLWPIKLQTICLKCFLSVAVLRHVLPVYYLL